NRRGDVERLRAAGVPVWGTVIRTLDEAFASLGRLFADARRWPGPPRLRPARDAWRDPAPGPPARPAGPHRRDPRVVVGAAPIARLGLDNVYRGQPERYPHVTLDDLAARDPELIVLPDEPYAFSQDDGPEMFPGRRVALVEGRSLTWYGPSLVTARATLLEQ